MSDSITSRLSQALLHRPDAAVSAIDWCELNYAYTPHVAELWNTMSSLLFVAAGASMLGAALRLRLPPLLVAAGPLTALTGAASALFHATLWLGGQRADEVAENLTLVALLHAAFEAGGGAEAAIGARALVHGAVAAAGILLVSAFLFTELHLILTAVALTRQLQLLAQPVSARPGAAGAAFSARLQAAALAGLVGATCWLLDKVACSALTAAGNPQLHAWWHVLGAVCLHEAFNAAAIAHVVLRRSEPCPGLVPMLGGLVYELRVRK